MNKLRKILLAAMLLAMPFFNSRAVDDGYSWYPEGESVDDNGYALNADEEYAAGDVINADLSVYASAEEDAVNTLTIDGVLNTDLGRPSCSLKVDGEVFLDATDADLDVTISSSVVIEPYSASFAPDNDVVDPSGFAHIIFNAAAGKTITVNVDNDLTFRGVTATAGVEDTDYTDMYITFMGQGQTKFIMADGTKIAFDGDIDDTFGGDETYSNEAAGTKVFVTMDQSLDQYELGQNKVLFERLNDGDASLRTMIYVGPNSLITYISDDATGLGDEEGSTGYASVGIDPSARYLVEAEGSTEEAPLYDEYFGTGRMVLFVKGAYDIDVADDATDFSVTQVYPFNDGAIVVAGHYVTDFGHEDGDVIDYSALRTPFTVQDPELTLYHDFSTPAGVKAALKIVDHNSYEAGTTEFTPVEGSKRGLLVVNDCQSLGKYAADPYMDYYNQGIDTAVGPLWAYSLRTDKNVRPGFVLGVNGVVDVYDNAFFDYVGGAINQVDALALADASGDTTALKNHNPSALMVDGLDDGFFNSPIRDDDGAIVYSDAGDPTFEALSAFDAANPFVDGVFDVNADITHAQFILRGHAKAFFKNGASTLNGFIYNLFVDLSGDEPALYEDGAQPYNDPTIDLTNYLAISDIDPETGFFSTVGYDGYQLENPTSGTTTVGEGEQVLDVEGRFSVENWANNSIYTNDAEPVVRVYLDGEGASADENYDGQFGIATLLTDYAGDEITLETTSTDEGDSQDPVVVTRPLSTTGAYVRYNSPAIMNNSIINFMDTYWVHNDPSKYITGEPLYSEPAIVGGDALYYVTNVSPLDEEDIYRAYVFPNRYRFPEMRLYNTDLELHESLCASGVRFVVKDDGVIGSNESIIRFYNHGFDLDNNLTGFGRLFVLGSQLSTMSGADDEAGGLTNEITESAFLNVYRHTVLNGDGSFSTAKLSLCLGDEFPEGVPTTQHSQHIIWMGIPTAANALVGVYLGWPGLNADGLPSGDQTSYPYIGEPLGTDTDYLFTLDANLVSPAELAIQGDLIGFGACDENGVGARVPVKDEYDSGNIFVDYGGKLSLSKNAIPTRTVAVPVISTYIDTSIASRFWPDYNYAGDQRLTWYSGEVDLPKTQTVFGEGYSVQPYGITSDMLTANLDETLGYVRLGYENTSQSLVGDRTGAKSINIAWPFRDYIMAPITKVSDTAMVRTIDLPYIMYAGAGDVFDSVNVSGATLTDPFYMDVSGAGTNKFAIVNAYASLKSTRDIRFLGEGEHALLCVEFGGTIGLGGDKTNAWTLLGKDYVTVCPLGDGTVNLNGNVKVADSLAILASDTFGQFGDSATSTSSHRLRFYASRDCEIRVPANTELDLSSFGHSNGRQEIAFDGKVKLVLEPGATIRFPESTTVTGGVVLYFNGESQLVCEGINEALKGIYPTRIAADDNRIKFIGKGQIWFNKNAKMQVMGSALVGVQAELGATTDVTLSLARQSQVLIGDANISGGAFEVGNPSEKTGSSVIFKLAINGPQALFHIDREGFFGLGAGIVNKIASNPNGLASATNNPTINATTKLAQKGEDQVVVFYPDEPTYIEAVPDESDEVIALGDAGEGTAWQVQALKDVTSITFDLRQGAFDHMNIYDGSDNQSSLMVVGPAAGYTFNINGLSQFVIRGGGNLMYIPTTPVTDYTSLPFHVVNVWDYSSPIGSGEQYSLFSNSKMLLTKTATSSNYRANGRTVSFTSNADAFSFLGFEPYNDQKSKFADVGATQFGARTGFVNYDTAARKYGAYYYDATTTTTTSWSTMITRSDGASINNGKLIDAVQVGALQCIESNNVGPTTFAVPTV